MSIETKLQINIHPHLLVLPILFSQAIDGNMAGKMVADAAVMVADAALNGVFQGLAQALTPIIQKKLGQFWGVDDKKLRKLRRYLLGIQPLLNDAETRQFTEDAVRSWVSDLRGVAYDLEDIVDEMNAELLRLQLDETKKSEGKQVVDFISTFFGAMENYTFNYQIAVKINEVMERWEEIVEYGNLLHLREGIGGKALEVIGKRRETTSFVVESSVIGREIEKGKILSFLESDKVSARGNLSVIAIVGMGGIGKTTLAKLAYKEAVGFHLRVWVHVSHEFDCARVSRSIIESITSAQCELRVLDPLQRLLEELVRDKKVLLVLDDAWTESPDDWETLTMPLRSAQKGSKIIVTTRSERVSKSIGINEMYKLEHLSDDDCWDIVKEKLLGCSNIAGGHPHLENIRVEVVRKCNGLPLTANMLGGLLCTIEIDKWERLLKSEIWDLPKTKDHILPALMLSYLCLASHIKCCFAYTAIFPKGCLIRKDDLVRLWMAEGFVEASKSETLEDTGNDYFDNLVARHFLQKVNYEFYMMHDLIHDLAEEILGSVFFRIEEEVVTNRPTEETRYMSLSDLVIDKRLLSKLFKAKSLRTLKVISENINGILDEVIHNFERLHVLDLSWSSIMELPESIGNLKYLRYLSLQWNGLERLPDSICGLFNLQTLYLDDCHHLVELPKDMGSLINLRHLTLSGTGLQMLPDSICKLKKLQVIDLSCCKEFTALPIDIGSLINLRCLNLHGTDIQRLPNSICKLHDLQCLDLLGCRELSELPKEMSNLINLQKLEVDTELLRNSLLPRIGRFPNLQGLKNYVVAKESGIGQLRVLANLHGELNITDLENVQSAEEARTANLKDKNNIQGLGLCWSSPDPFSFRDENVEAEVLEALEPPCAELRRLVVENYGGFKFPSWMGDTSFSNLVEIELIDCRKCKLLGPLGQLPSLEKLVIKRMYALKHIGREVFGNGSFPSLRTLKLKHLPNLEGRFEVKDSDLLHLIELEVRNCPKLTELPVAPLTLRALRIYGCKKECGLNNLIFIPMLPSLKELEVGNGNEMVLSNSLPYLTSLSSLKVFGIRSVTLLQDGILQPLTNLERLIIKDCYKLLTLPRGLPTTLSDLDIAHCPNLRSLPKGFQNLTSLARLSIKHCPLLQVPQGELTNFPLLKVLRVTGYNKSILLNVLPNLSTLVNLVIDEFDWPSYLPDNLLQNLTSLQNLVIEYCAQLISLPNGLPSSLKTLYIGHCAELTSLPNELPSSLEKVLITGCAKVKSLPKGLNKLTSLEQLYIWKCPLIESFPEDGLPIDLLFLSISHCPTLVQRCRQQGNKEWNMTKHVQQIVLDAEYLHDDWC